MISTPEPALPSGKGRVEPGKPRSMNSLLATTGPLDETLGRQWQQVADGWPIELSYQWLYAEYGRVSGEHYVTVVKDRSGAPVAAAAWFIVSEDVRRRGYSVYDLLFSAPLLAQSTAAAEQLSKITTDSCFPCCCVVMPGTTLPAVIFSRHLSPSATDYALDQLLNELEFVADRYFARAISFPNIPVTLEWVPLSQALRRRGYSATLRPPCCTLEIPSTFDSYLETLAPRRRKKVGKEMQRFANAVDAVEIHDAPRLLDPGIAELVSARYRKYGHATTREEVDERLQRSQLLPNLRVLVAMRGSAPCAFGAFALDPRRGRIVSRFGGAADNNFFAYFNMTFYERIRYGMLLGYKLLEIGTDSYAGKLRRGCRLEGRLGYVKVHSDNLDSAVAAAAQLSVEGEVARLRTQIPKLHLPGIEEVLTSIGCG